MARAEAVRRGKDEAVTAEETVAPLSGVAVGGWLIEGELRGVPDARLGVVPQEAEGVDGAVGMEAALALES